jgi:hypothetical protein
VLANVRIGISSVQWVEVVPVIEHVSPKLFGLRGCSPDVCIVGVLGMKLDGDAHVRHFGSSGRLLP